MLLLRRRRRRKERQPEKRWRSCWVREIFTKRKQQGAQSCAWNATGGPRVLFQVIQVVSADGLSQFLVIMHRVWSRRRQFVTANQSRIGNYFLLNFCWHQILLFRYAYAYVFVVQFTFAITRHKHKHKHKHKKKEKFPFSYTYAYADVTPVHTTRFYAYAHVYGYAYAYVTSVNQP